MRGSRDSKDPMFTMSQFNEIVDTYNKYRKKKGMVINTNRKLTTGQMKEAVDIWKELTSKQPVEKGKMVSKGRVIPPKKYKNPKPASSSSYRKSNK